MATKRSSFEPAGGHDTEARPAMTRHDALVANVQNAVGEKARNAALAELADFNAREAASEEKR